MLDITLEKLHDQTIVHLNGRVDGISAPELEIEFNRLMMDGERTIVAQCARLNFISSAGLRIFLSTQKALKKIGGELIIASLPPQVMEVFRVSGFAAIFRMIEFDGGAMQAQEIQAPDDTVTAVHNGVSITCRKFSAPQGTLTIIGSSRKLESARYGPDDLIAARAASIAYGTGVAALGDSFEDVKNVFGETVILNGNFFSYPAVKRSAVDYLLASQQNAEQTYKFLHGFGFAGPFCAIAEFSKEDGLLDLAEIFSAASSLVQSNLFGVVFMGESAGLYGMNLKKVPIAENAPSDGTIFDQLSFSEWIDYPIDAAFTFHSVAGTGIGVKDRTLLPASAAEIFSQDASFHAHAAIFDKSPLKRSLSDFEKEFQRVLTEFEALKVQHLLGKSKFKSVIAGIIQLETL